MGEPVRSLPARPPPGRFRPSRMPAHLDSVTDLVKGLRHAAAPQRLSAARALAALGPGAQKALPTLRKLFDDTDAAVREAAAVAVGRTGPAALPELAAALRHDDRHVRRQAVWAL